MKRKLITLGMTFLLCVGMIGAGFASWLITGDVTSEVAGNVVFGGETNDRGTQGWLKYDGEVAQMDITFDVEVTNYTDLENEAVTFAIELTDANGAALNFDDYVNLPTIDENVLTWDMLKDDGKATVTLKFTWGSKFGNVNPLTYYTDLGYSDDNATLAYSALTTLYGFNGEGFKVTITGTVA